MVQIGDKIVSFDVIQECFICDLDACKGVCCIDGDSGAPLTEDEMNSIESSFDVVKKYLSEKNLKEIEKQGLYEIDDDGDYVTPCINGGECVYLVDDNGINKCAFEIAYRKGEIDFIKPISCHLYPIRLGKYSTFTAVNYQKRNICAAGRVFGKKENVKLYQFLKEPLIRAFGSDWYEQLDYAANNLEIK